MKSKNLIITAIISLMICQPARAADGFSLIKFANPLDFGNDTPVNTTVDIPKKVTLTHNDVHNQYVIALDRFMQSNVKSSYADFKVLLETMSPSDTAYILISEKLAYIGFFTLSDYAMTKAADKDLTDVMAADIKHYYFPSKKLSPEDEIYLGELYSNINYNAQSREATEELLKNTNLMATSDYANYIAALGYFRSNNLTEAEIYINNAISMNPQNLNYKRLKAEILAQNKQGGEALKIVDFIKSQNLASSEFVRKINSLEMYVNYLTQKNEINKKYYLGYYYYYENEPVKAIRTLQSAITTKKKYNKEVFALLSRVYFDNHDFEKALDTATKANKLDGGNCLALSVLGDLSFKNADYKSALKYYKHAESKDKNGFTNAEKVALTYQKLGDNKKAGELYARILKATSSSYMSYYHIGLFDKNKELSYLKKAVAVNPYFIDGWIDLARCEIERQNFKTARQYLAVANYIDENNFRYYYYQGLLSKHQGNINDAVYNFKKSLILNPDFTPAKEELSI